jgi:hypothetical protein
MPGANEQLDDLGNTPNPGADAAKPAAPAGNTPADSAKQGEAASEALARRRGWVPKEEFEGDATKWVDADTFIERGNNFNSTLKKELAAVKAELANFKGTAEAFKKFHAEAMKGKQSELDTALKQLKSQHREAIRDGDDDAADALEGRMDVLRKDKADLQKELDNPTIEPKGAPDLKTATPEAVETLQAWVKDGNEWFENDLPMQAYALKIAEQLAANGETLRGRSFMEKVGKQVRADFPHKFSNPNRQREGSTESGQQSVKTGPARTAKDLPEEDRKLMKEFISAGWVTEEKFLKDYRWE